VEKLVFHAAQGIVALLDLSQDLVAGGDRGRYWPLALSGRHARTSGFHSGMRAKSETTAHAGGAAMRMKRRALTRLIGGKDSKKGPVYQTPAGPQSS